MISQLLYWNIMNIELIIRQVHEYPEQPLSSMMIHDSSVIMKLITRMQYFNEISTHKSHIYNSVDQLKVHRRWWHEMVAQLVIISWTKQIREDKSLILVATIIVLQH